MVLDCGVYTHIHTKTPIKGHSCCCFAARPVYFVGVGRPCFAAVDFGLATVLRPPIYKAVEPVGSPGYAAPELLRVIPFDFQVDMFSLGVVAFVLLSGEFPCGVVIRTSILHRILSMQQKTYGNTNKVKSSQDLSRL